MTIVFFSISRNVLGWYGSSFFPAGDQLTFLMEFR